MRTPRTALLTVLPVIVLSCRDADVAEPSHGAGGGRESSVAPEASSFTDAGDPAARSPDGSLLAVPNEDGTVRIVDVSTRHEVGALYEPMETRFLAVSALVWVPDATFAPDGRMLATYRGSEPVRLWNTADFRDSRTLDPLGVVHRVTFSPSSRQILALGASDKASGLNLLAVWDVSTGARLVNVDLRQEGLEIVRTEFSNDETTIQTVASDGVARRFPLSGPSTVEALAGEDDVARLAALRRLEELTRHMPTKARCVDSDPSAKLKTIGLRVEDLVPALAGGLARQNTEIRRTSTVILGRLGTHSRSVEASVVSLLEDPHASVRRAAVVALGHLEWNRLVPLLLQAAEDESGPVRDAALARLAGLYGCPTGIEENEAVIVAPLLSKALSSPRQEIRSTVSLCLWGIGGTGARAAVSELSRAVEDDSVEVRVYAAAALLRADPGNDLAERTLLQNMPTLNHVLRGSRFSEVLFAADVVGRLGPRAKDAVPALLEEIACPRQWAEPGIAAERALYRIGTAAIPALKEALESDDENVRRAALEALEHLDT